jgi:Na+/melibiose symporter-like transporter
MEENKTSKKKRVNDLWIYPTSELAGGIYKAYFSTYLSMLMTTVYMFPVVLSGILEAVNSIIHWVGAPFFGALFDKFSFKKSKFWPWFIVCGSGCGIFYILIFCLPVMFSDPSKLAVLCAICIALAAFLASGASQIGLAIFAHTSKDSHARAKMGSASKITRDGMKFVVGLLFPVMLTSFTAYYNGVEMKAWALTAVILAGTAAILYAVVGIMCKHSDVEREAVANRDAVRTAGKKKGSFMASVKSLIGNRALLTMFVAFFLSKIVYFFHIMGGSYFWRYYMGSFATMGTFTAMFTIAALAGAAVTPTLVRLLKDTKLTYVLAFVGQLVCYIIGYFVFKPENVIGTLVVFAVVGLFNGVSDSLILPLIAGSVDYAEWKFGKSEPGLTMSTYSIGVSVGSLLSTTLRTAILAAAGFDASTIAAGVPASVSSALLKMNTVYPIIICAVIIVMVSILYPITDKKLATIKEELAARKEKEQA